MRTYLSFGAAAFAVTLVVVAVPSCKTATAIRAHYTTDFGCKDGYLERKVMFSVSRTGEPLVFDGRDPNDADSCIPGPRATVGDTEGLVLRPNESAEPRYDGTYELVAIVGTEGSTESSCNLGPDGKPKGDLGGEKCVVARRKVRFVSGSEVTQNVFLSSRCAGVLCPEGRSCNPATRLCAEVTENAESESGGNPTIPETDGGAPPLDAGADATIRLDAGADATVTDIPLCNSIAPAASCGGLVSLGAPSTLVPKVVAGFGRAAWIDPGTRTIHEATFPNIGTPVVSTLPTPPFLDPQHLAYSDVKSRGPRLGGAFVSSVGGSESGDVVRLWDGMAWSNVDGSFGGHIAAFVSDGSFIGGWVTSTPALVLPFEIDGASAAVHSQAPADPTIAPFMGSSPGATQHRFVWAHGTSTSFLSPGGKVTTMENTLPTRSQASRLVTYGPNQHIVAITTMSDVVYFDDGILAGAPFAVPILSDVVDAAADAEHIYVVRPNPNTKASEVVVVNKAALPTLQMCRVAPVLNIRAITLDDTCVYLTTAEQATGANVALSLQRVRKQR